MNEEEGIPESFEGENSDVSSDNGENDNIEREEENETPCQEEGGNRKRKTRAEKREIKFKRLLERRKEKAKEYKIRKRARIESQQQNCPENETVLVQRPSKQEMNDKLRNALLHGVNVCVDTSFEDLHSDRELSSLAKQLALTYGFLKKTLDPIHLHICGLKPASALYEKLQRQGFESWICDRHESLPWDLFPIDSLIMLSPDADEVVESFELDKIYIIGGIVDRSVKKNQSLTKASEKKIACKRLPIQEFIPNRVSHILNIDTCIEIICSFVEKKNWEEVLKEKVPQRKQNQIRNPSVETVEEEEVESTNIREEI